MKYDCADERIGYVRQGGKRMNEYERLSRQAERYKKQYPPGTRIELIEMEDSLAPVPSGTRGTVKVVDDIGQLHMHWDNGRSLAVVPGEDSFRKLTPEEVEAENQSVSETEDANHSMTMGM